VETFEKSHSVLLNVSVDSVQQSLVIRTPEEVEAVEGLPYVFSSFKCNEVAVDPTARCAAIQVLSRDNGDLTLLTRFFRLQIQVKFGSLSFPESVRSDRALEFLKGSGKGDAVVQLYGKLCALNSALRTLSYIPNPDFNTIYNHVNRSWSPAANAEIIKITVEQPSPEGARTSVLVGQTAEAEVPVTVKPVDARPEMTIPSGTRGRDGEASGALVERDARSDDQVR